MKPAMLAIGLAAFAIAGCSSDNDDALDNMTTNDASAEINALADEAANDAAAQAETDVLNNQLEAIENTPADNTLNPIDEDEQNVAGM